MDNYSRDIVQKIYEDSICQNSLTDQSYYRRKTVMLCFFNDPGFRQFLYTLNTEINFSTEITWLIVALVLSMIGGAIGGMMLAGKEIGYKFSAVIGSLFAPAGVIPAMIFGSLILTFFSKY